ncbi:MAG: branched-chain amino acid ABC transporter permease [Xanthobacteraceae bacterium]|nr:branched-chain amino acid ABC transporter permease [Xanthobacteraceae bacterium]
MTARDVLPIVVVVALLALIPPLVSANTVLNFLVFTLIIALAAQGWNILGGYGGQYSFGHAVFFGTGAYATAVLQVHAGLNAWLTFGLGIAAGALVGFVIGFLSFRSGLRGSYFALVTLAFAEVFRIVANVAGLTGGAAGILIKLDVRPENFQFQSRGAFVWIGLGLVAAVLLATRAIERARFGAYLTAVRENEDAARALGVDPFRVKLAAITLSAAVTAAAGCLYAQYFLFLDANIAYGAWISVEALVAPIIGGIGTVFGPLVGALALQGLGHLTSHVAGEVPGIDLVVFGVLLIVMVAFAPEGIVGLLARLRRLGRRRPAEAT